MKCVKRNFNSLSWSQVHHDTTNKYQSVWGIVPQTNGDEYKKQSEGLYAGVFFLPAAAVSVVAAATTVTGALRVVILQHYS
jgi:hypothetical protein